MFPEIPEPLKRTVAVGDFFLISALIPSLLNHIFALSLMFLPSRVISIVCPRCAARGDMLVNWGATWAWTMPTTKKSVRIIRIKNWFGRL